MGKDNGYIKKSLIFAVEKQNGALAHLARARHWQCRGDRFESGMLHTTKLIRILFMSKIKDFYIKYLSRINKYWLVTILFLALTFTAGDSNLYQRYLYDEKIRSLEKEIKEYEEEIRINSEKLRNLRTDKEGLERFAREEYFMKRENEDVYIIKEKN